MPNQRFAELFSQMTHGAMAFGHWASLTQTAKGPGLYDHLAELCHVGVSTVISWKSKGSIPADPTQVGLLAEFAMANAKMSYWWLEEFLREGHCFDTELLDKYRITMVPERPLRALHNLPAITRDFIERPEAVQRILEGLEYGYPISIEGFGGMGKSTLAIWLAERCLTGEQSLLSPLFERAVWISAKDFPNFDLGLNDVLNSIAERTGFTGLTDLPLKQKQQEIYELLQVRRVLVVADNMETVTDATIYEFLRRIRGESRVLLTTRRKQYRSVWEVTVEGLDGADALRKIRQEIRSKDLHTLMTVEDSVLIPLVQMTEGNPKAIELTLGYVKRTGIPLAEAIQVLDEAIEDVEGLFPYLFERDWRALDELARQVVLAMPLFTGDARRDALQDAIDLHGHAFKSASEQLTELSLLDLSKPGIDGEIRYAIHPLTRAFARTQLKSALDLEEKFYGQWANWYVIFAERNGASWRTYDLLEEEKQNLIECVERCYEMRSLEWVLRFEAALTEFFSIRGHWEARSRIGNLALRAAKDLGNEIAYAWVIIRAITPALEHLRRDEQRDSLCREALTIFESHGDRSGIAAATYCLGTIYARLRGYSIARPLLDQSLRMWEALGNADEIAEVLNYLGMTCWREKRLEEGRRFLQRAWDYWKEQDRPSWQGNVRGNLGRIEMDLGNLEEAEALLTEALHLFETIRHPYNAATVKYEISRIKHRKGNIAQARDLLLEAKEAYLTVGAWERTSVIVTSLYCLEQTQGDLSIVQHTIQEMIDLYHRLEMPDEQATMERLLSGGCPEMVDA